MAESAPQYQFEFHKKVAQLKFENKQMGTEQLYYQYSESSQPRTCHVLFNTKNPSYVTI